LAVHEPIKEFQPMSPAITDREEFARVTKFAREAVDTAVGLGVLGLQRLQVGRVELQKRLATHETFGAGYSLLRTEALRRAGQADRLVTEALRTVESTFEPVAGRLPEPARHLATVAQSRIDELHARVSRHLADATQPTETPEGTNGD
jgi:hypothetical protein